MTKGEIAGRRATAAAEALRLILSKNWRRRESGRLQWDWRTELLMLENQDKGDLEGVEGKEKEEETKRKRGTMSEKKN